MAVTQTVSLVRTEVAADRARAAYVAFIAFIFTVYASLPQLVPPLEALAPGKTVIAFAAVTLAWSCVVGRRPFRFGLVAGGKALYLFFALVALSPLWSLWPKLSLDTVSESLKFFAAFVVAANVLDTRRRIRQAMAAIAIASLFPALGAIWNFASGAPLVEGTRAMWLGVFHNPNFLAFHLVLSTALVLGLRAATPRGRAARLAWLGVIGIYAVAVLLTGSRGGALGMAAVLLLWLARSMARGKIAIGAALAVGIALLVTPMSPLNREDTQENLVGEVDASAQGRIDAWRTALLGLPALAVFAAALVGAFLGLGGAARRAPPRASAIARGLQIALFGWIVCSLTGGYAFSWPVYFCFGIAAAVTLRERHA